MFKAGRNRYLGAKNLAAFCRHMLNPGNPGNGIWKLALQYLFVLNATRGARQAFVRATSLDSALRFNLSNTQWRGLQDGPKGGAGAEY